MIKQYSIICIFTNFGKTYTFKDIELLIDNETTIQFSYRAMSDGLEKIGTFPKSNICGWSLTESGNKAQTILEDLCQMERIQAERPHEKVRR